MRGGIVLAVLAACAPVWAGVTAQEWIVDGVPISGVTFVGKVELGAAAPDGKGKCIKATLAKGADWPGVTIAFDAPQDWTNETALKFDLILDADKPVAFNLRVDRVGTTDADFKSRFNLAGVKELMFQPGANALRVSVERMVNGHLNNPGLDVSKVTKVTLFVAKPARDLTLSIRRVWLEKATVDMPEFPLADFVQRGLDGWKTSGGLAGSRPGPKGWFEINVKPQPGAGKGPAYAAMECDALPTSDWQGYDRLVLGCVNPLTRDLSMGVNLLDRSGKEVMFRFKAKPGPSEIEMPLAAAEIMDLSRVVDVKLLVSPRSDIEMTIGLSRLGLKRTEGRRVTLVETPGEAPAAGDWVIDLSRFYDSRGDRRLADLVLRADIPEKQFVVRCRPASTSASRLILPAEIASKCFKAECWATGFCVNRGEMLVYYATAKPADEAGVTYLRFIGGVGP